MRDKNPNRRLSDNEYGALSASEKRALWAKRGNARRSAPTRVGHGKGQHRFQQFIAVVLFGGLVFAAVFHERLPTPAMFEVAVEEAPVTATFTACKWRGGTNCVVDGDTFYLQGRKIRMAGIDAPETHDYGCAEELALGEQAAERLRGLLNAGPVTLSSIDRDEDVYGRKLRNAAVNGRDAGETLISEGLAREYAGGRRSWC